MANVSAGQQTTYPLDQTEELFAGSLPDLANQSDNILAYVSEEASAEIPFGVMLAQGTGDRQTLLMAAQADVLIGISVRSQAYQSGLELGDDGLKPKTTVSVLRRGRVWVETADAVSPGDAVRVDEAGGTFAKDAVNDETVDISANASWLTSAGAGELALLEFDMTGLNTNKTSDAA